VGNLWINTINNKPTHLTQSLCLVLYMSKDSPHCFLPSMKHWQSIFVSQSESPSLQCLPILRRLLRRLAITYLSSCTLPLLHPSRPPQPSKQKRLSVSLFIITYRHLPLMIPATAICFILSINLFLTSAIIVSVPLHMRLIQFVSIIKHVFNFIFMFLIRFQKYSEIFRFCLNSFLSLH